MPVAGRVLPLDDEEALTVRLMPFAAEDFRRVRSRCPWGEPLRFARRAVKARPTFIPRTDDLAKAGGEVHATPSSSRGAPAPTRSRMRSATSFASGPVLPTGPTQ